MWWEAFAVHCKSLTPWCHASGGSIESVSRTTDESSREETDKSHDLSAKTSEFPALHQISTGADWHSSEIRLNNIGLNRQEAGDHHEEFCRKIGNVFARVGRQRHS